MSCETLNCIYIIVCQGCDGTYIGETNNLRLRMNLHRDHSIKNIGLPISKHIYNCASTKDIKFKVMPFYKVNKDDEFVRKEKEKHFMNKCKPTLNVLH